MANKMLFNTAHPSIPTATTRNNAGGRAYEMTPRHQLAQYASTGCLNGTFYSDAAEQLETVVRLCTELPPEYIARTAIYARQAGRMKDMPALLCAILSTRDGALLESIFSRVIDNGRMLRNFVQMIRSGVVGRMSLGTLPKRLVRKWFDERSDVEIFRASIGNDPSFADIIKMVHPRPATASRKALYAWFIGRPYEAKDLPPLVREFETFKSGSRNKMPDVPFQMLTSLPLAKREWKEIAWNASWQTLRMNLNTFSRHGVFDDPHCVKLLSKRLGNPAEVHRAKAFPYQLLAAWKTIVPAIPAVFGQALRDAMEHSIANVPDIDGKVVICPDVSGSMSYPITGMRSTASSSIRCVDAAALIAAAILRKNPRAEVLPFHDKVVPVKLSGHEPVAKTAMKLAALGSGGTNCSAPLELLNKNRETADLIIYVSDNESWMDRSQGRGTATMEQWRRFKARNHHARMVCIDLVPNRTAQACDDEDILNIGGFSDAVFDVISDFAKSGGNAGHWVRRIEEIVI